MLCKGMQQRDIAKSLSVSEATITSDVRALQDRSDQLLNNLAERTLPFMYEKCIDGINEVLKECWVIYNDKDNPEKISQWHKQGALKLAKECNESLMKLFIEGPSVIAARRIKDQLNEVIAGANGNSIGVK